MQEGKLLIVDDNKSALKALEIFLQYEFEKVKTISNPNQITSLLESEEYDVILLDMNFTAGVSNGNEGFYWLNEISKTANGVEIVLFTSYGDVELAVRSVKEGAADFIIKPWDNDKMIATLKSAYRLGQSKREVKILRNKEVQLKREINKEHKTLIGSSVSMQNITQLVSKVAKTEANILITGENGTGKEIVAREIHRQSLRNNELIISVDMGAITETLFESELFGHKIGAFTDAKEDKTGKFELANKGTLFLDEIGNLPMPSQAKILATLENRKITPVGSNKETPIDIRLICATNSDISAMVDEGRFREDLLYRINTIHIEIPPLRERLDDIDLLANFFLEKYSHKYSKSNMAISESALKLLGKHHWPGNVRELQHTVEKAVILSDSATLHTDDFFFRKTGRKKENLPETLDEMEKRMIEDALINHQGKYSLAAKQLGISRQTLYNKLKKLGK